MPLDQAWKQRCSWQIDRLGHRLWSPTFSRARTDADNRSDRVDSIADDADRPARVHGVAIEDAIRFEECDWRDRRSWLRGDRKGRDDQGQDRQSFTAHGSFSSIGIVTCDSASAAERRMVQFSVPVRRFHGTLR
jgi:hypothetical protein